MLRIPPDSLAQMIDVSILQTDNTASDLHFLIETAKKYRFICAFSLPCYLPELVSALHPHGLHVGAPIGFPTGAELSGVKAFQARTLYEVGCDEFDMVMNVGFLKSGRFAEVAADIKAVRDEIHGKLLKVIVESMLLTDSELADACRIVADSGADYVKTGSGWAGKPTEMKHVDIMAKTVGGKIKIKAAGGIRDYETVCRMHELGVTRFGVGVKSGIALMEQANSGK